MMGRAFVFGGAAVFALAALAQDDRVLGWLVLLAMAAGAVTVFATERKRSR